MNLFITALALLFLISPFLFFKINQAQNLSVSRIIYSSLGFSLFISAFGFVGLIPDVTASMRYFFLLQLMFAGMGFLMLYMLKKHTWGVFQNKKISEALFLLLNAAGGMIGFTLLFNLVNSTDMGPWFSMSVLTFLLPGFIVICFREYIEIPEQIYKVWYYPVDGDEIDFEHIDTATIYMLELEYSKSPIAGSLTNTKLRAPVGMHFGDWFRSFIESWNAKHDRDPIDFLDEDNSPYGWIFYVKPSFLGSPRYIDPDLTILQNKIIEKRAIIARRVGLV